MCGDFYTFAHRQLFIEKSHTREQDIKLEISLFLAGKRRLIIEPQGIEISTASLVMAPVGAYN